MPRWECAIRAVTPRAARCPKKLVTDNNTGLIWQMSLPVTYAGCTGGSPAGSKCTWQEAIDYCANLSYGTYDDGDCRSRKELATLPDYDRSGPAIDTGIFPGTQSDYYWSSSSYVNITDQAWHVYFTNGYVNSSNKDRRESRPVCESAVLPASAFTEASVSGKVLVTDTTTGLVWTKEKRRSGVELAGCPQLLRNPGYGGDADWRLPNIEELKTLIGGHRVQPGKLIPRNYIQFLLVILVRVDSAVNAWSVVFYSGNVYYSDKNRPQTTPFV